MWRDGNICDQGGGSVPEERLDGRLQYIDAHRDLALILLVFLDTSGD